MKTCGFCGVENPDGSAFCQKCRAPLKTPSLLDVVLGERSLCPSQYEYPGDREGIKTLQSLQLDKIVKLYIKYWSGPQGMAALLGNAVEITPRQFAEIYETGLVAARNLDMPMPRMFIMQNPILNAATYGVDNDNFVMLTSSIVDSLKPDELLFTLGHEFGHIKSNHVLYLNAAHWAISGAVALLGMIVAGGPLGLVIGTSFRVAVNDWSRKAEYTADRAGLLACRSIDAAVLSLVKITLGARSLADKIDLQAFLRQIEDETATDYGFVEAFQSHPFMPKRVRELQGFYRNQYNALVGDHSG